MPRVLPAVKYPKDKLKVIFVIDGNTDEDVYMMDMFKEVFHEEDVGTFVWSENYHTIKTPEDLMDESNPEDTKPLKDYEAMKIIEELVRTKRCVSVTDTKLDEMATVERSVKVLEADEKCGAVGGDVRILNVYDQRACQSYFDCVSCISGPLGMFRNDIIQIVLESWYNQKFLGNSCELGDNHHLTNSVLGVGYHTKYTNKSRAYTKEPSQFIGWWNQQTNWSRSYLRMWFCNARWWHKHHIWMTYESVVSVIYPFFLTATVVRLLYSGSLWNIVWLFLWVQIIFLVISVHACCLRRKLPMILLSLYSVLYMGGILPSKFFALLTISRTGHKKIVGCYFPLLSMSIWAAVVFWGLVYSLHKNWEEEWSSPGQQTDLCHLLYGLLAYAIYWVLMGVTCSIWIYRCQRMRSQSATVSHTP
ncbi:hypothetical protein GDO86_004946 [Hymenochirus boettgeri]|uniref:Hyaluronan synthase 1 n=1 Tax=Hymenochirus boettgeri TaxID=247094 RepID=A0A8T2J2Q6_9PIPI|nr:hypothetical protein GDO86_004946 [Hymenochirus boettgeri]